jgi:hypothetical protein
VVHHQVRDDPNTPAVRLVDQVDEVPEVSELGEDLEVVADVVTAVPQRRVVDRQKPQAVNTKPLKVVKLAREATKVTGAVTVRVGETTHEYLVENRTFVPLRVAGRLLVAWPCATPHVIRGGTGAGTGAHAPRRTVNT